MTRKGGAVAIQKELLTDDDWTDFIENDTTLLCIEIYSEFCGQCNAMIGALKKLKMDLGDDVAMGMAMADNIIALERFRGRSEPIYIIVSHGSLRRIMWGANAILLTDLINQELELKKEAETSGVPRASHHISQLLPEELSRKAIEDEITHERKERNDSTRQAHFIGLKRRRAELVAPHVTSYNFILFWPHCHQAHVDLYQHWDDMGILVFSKETPHLDEDQAKDVVWLGDVDLNEAALESLTKGEALAVCFRTVDGSDLIEIMRKVIYEDLPAVDPEEEHPEQIEMVTAFERYLTYSLKPEEVIQLRQEERAKRKEEETIQRRIKRKEDRLLAKQAEREAIKVELEDSGADAKDPSEQSPPAEEPPQIEEDDVDDISEPEPEEEIDEGYIPPGGLMIPGFYSPPNELARANGMILLFPRIVSEQCPIEVINFPPHIIMMFRADKRNEIKKVVEEYKNEILNIGFFSGPDPYHSQHVAYTFKHYEQSGRRIHEMKDRVALMVSRKRSLPSLSLVPLGPMHVSITEEEGELEGIALFPVYYGDGYRESESDEEETAAA